MLLRVLWYCYELSRNQWLKPIELKRLQEKRLRAIIRHAYENVPLYRKKFDLTNVRPDDVKSIEDLSKLPFTTKPEIWSGIPDQSIAKGYDINDCVRRSTSGTSGGPMPVFYDKRFWDYIVADWYYRQVRIKGLNPWDKSMNVSYSIPEPDVIRSGEDESSDELKRRSRGRVALGSSVSLFKRWRKRAYIAYSADEIIQDIIDYQPKALKGNASYLRLVAETMVDKGIEDVHLKALVSWGEVLDEPARRLLESSFGCEVFNSYGANEVGSLAWECKRKEGLHIGSDFVILEVMRDGEPVNPHEPGEIVVTGLLNYAMPVIRYRLGDVGILDDERCSCGRGFPLLKSVEGRIVDCLSLPDGRTLSPKSIMNAVQGTPGVSRYRVVQESETRVTVELMRRKNDPEVSIDELTARCSEVLGDAVDVEVFVGGRENLKAKFRPVISKLTVSEEPRWTEPYVRTT